MLRQLIPGIDYRYTIAVELLLSAESNTWLVQFQAVTTQSISSVGAFFKYRTDCSYGK